MCWASRWPKPFPIPAPSCALFLYSCMYFCPEEDWGIVCICSSGVPDKVNGIRKCLYTIVHLLYSELLK